MNVDRDRLVETASSLIDIHSFTGDEEAMARRMVELYEELDLDVQWQQVVVFAILLIYLIFKAARVWRPSLFQFTVPGRSGVATTTESG